MARKRWGLRCYSPDGKLIVPDGPGTQLKAILESLALMPKNCKCEKRAEEMDRWGVEGCRRRREEILGWLREGSDARGWIDRALAAFRALTTGLAFRVDPSDVLGSILDEALRRAEVAEAECRRDNPSWFPEEQGGKTDQGQ